MVLYAIHDDESRVEAIKTASPLHSSHCADRKNNILGLLYISKSDRQPPDVM